MKPALSRIAIVGLLAVTSLLASACGGDENTEKLFCELRVSGALAMETLCLDAEKELSFSVVNDGGAVCNVDMQLAGAAPQHFALSTNHIAVPANTTQQVTVKYHPTAAGGAGPGEQHLARVVITSDTKGGETFEISVDGETAATETKAILSLSCGEGVKACNDPNWDVTEPCCSVVDRTGDNGQPFYGRASVTQLTFGQVQSNLSVKVPLKVTNFGCGQLDLSELVLNPTTGTTFCDPSSVTVNTALPISVPGSVSVAGRQSATIELEFHPTELCNYFASATLSTNDPDIAANPTFGRFSIMGAGADPRVGTTASDLWFQEVAVGQTKEMKFSVYNKGNRAAEVASVSLRNGGDGAAFTIAKVERPLCPEGSGSTPLTAPFTLGPLNSDQSDVNCGEDQADITIRFAPNRAGDFSDHVEINYGDGIAVVSVRGRSSPKVVSSPDGVFRFYGPNSMGCEPLTCNPSCLGLCADSGDCNDGSECIDGVCASQNYGACVETCGTSERTIRFCNEGIAPLKFDDAAAGGGVVITGPNGGPAPMHRELESVDPGRHDVPVFAITANGCADTAGNGIELAVDACCEATISFLDTRNGGLSSAALHAYTNDPSAPRDSGGHELIIQAISDKDYNPEASFTAYDLLMGPGELNGPRMGRMAVLDASASKDPACLPEDANCTPQRFNPIVSYEWTLVDAGIGPYADAMEGPIDLDDPNARCPASINGGNCYEVVDLGAERGKVIHFYPDNQDGRLYKFRLVVKDGVCNPQHQSEAEQDIQVIGG